MSGIASASYAIATVLEVLDDPRDRAVVRGGRYLALGGVALGAPLLIDDLKRPARFLNMLRVFKARSPMSVGAWSLTAFGAFAALSAAIEWRRSRILPEVGPLCWLASRPSRSRFVGVLGLPFALVVLGYTGVLLAATAVPLWARARAVLPPLFVLSGASTSLAALSIVTGQHARMRPLERPLLLAELAASLLLVLSVGELGRPLTGGAETAVFWIGAVGVGQLLPLILRGRGPSSLLVLLGGLLLRRSIVYAGKESADDPAAAFAYHR